NSSYPTGTGSDCFRRISPLWRILSHTVIHRLDNRWRWKRRWTRCHCSPVRVKKPILDRLLIPVYQMMRPTRGLRPAIEPPTTHRPTLLRRRHPRPSRTTTATSWTVPALRGHDDPKRKAEVVVVVVASRTSSAFTSTKVRRC